MTFKLIKQLPKPKVLGIVNINIERNGNATCFLGDNFLAEIERVRIMWMAMNGFMLSGFEPAGCDKSGRIKYIYQEWYLVYLEEKEPLILKGVSDETFKTPML